MNHCVTFELKGSLKSPAFRPFIWRTVIDAGLSGWIAETPDGALLRLIGSDESIGGYIRSLAQRLPRSMTLTGITLLQKTPLPPEAGEIPHGFKIIGPLLCEAKAEADRAPCPECVRKMLDPDSRFYHYPFVSCPECGPRYSIQTLYPFSRLNSSFLAFPPCRECSADMEDHDGKQGNTTASCPMCGPSALLMDRSGQIADSYAPLETACESLEKGGIISVKTYDGFVTICDALNDAAVSELRKRKQIPSKPISLMARDIDVVRKYFFCSEQEAELLTSPAAPVVILKPHPDSNLNFQNICPDFPETAGVALPPTAMLRLLFESRPNAESLQGQFDLFAFAGGIKPVIPDDAGGDEDFREVAQYSDYVLNHDLKILQSSGPSVLYVQNGKPIIWRRSRGIAPLPLKLGRNLKRVSVALGGDSSAAVAIGCRNEVSASPRMGTVMNGKNARSLSLTAERLLLLHAQIPEIVVCDMDMQSFSSQEALRFAERFSLPLATAQRHHANAISCMTEHSITESLALVFDGGAYGPDGLTWGSELLHVTCHSFNRLCTFSPIPSPIPGQDGFRDPGKLFTAVMNSLGLNVPSSLLKRISVSEQEYEQEKTDRDFSRWGRTHAALSLFKAVGAAISLYREPISYETQSLLRMESAVFHLTSSENAEKAKRFFEFQMREDDGLMTVDWSGTFRNFADPAWMERFSTPELVMGFLHAVADAMKAMAAYGAGKNKCESIVLSGKAFLSPTLTHLTRKALEAEGFTVFTHEKTSPDESSICIGQAVFGGMS